MSESESERIFCTCFRVRRAARSLTRFYESTLSESGISVVQLSILAAFDHSGDPLPLGRLAERTGTDRTTLTRTIDRMVANGWIAEVDFQDARKRGLVITDEGRKTLARAARDWRQAEETIARALGGQELRDLWSMLAAVEDAAA